MATTSDMDQIGLISVFTAQQMWPILANKQGRYIRDIYIGPVYIYIYIYIYICMYVCMYVCMCVCVCVCVCVWVWVCVGVCVCVFVYISTKLTVLLNPPSATVTTWWSHYKTYLCPVPLPTPSLTPSLPPSFPLTPFPLFSDYQPLISCIPVSFGVDSRLVGCIT